MAAEREIDTIFAKMIVADEKDAYKYETDLIIALQRCAYAVCYLTINQPRKDIVHDAIQKAITHAKSFRADSKFSTWFYAIVKNACNSALKNDLTRRNRGEISIEEMEKSEDDPQSGEDVEAGAMARIDLEKIRENMNEVQKQILHFKMQGYTEEAIAKELTSLHHKPFTAKGVESTWARMKKKIVDKIMRNVGE